VHVQNGVKNSSAGTYENRKQNASKSDENRNEGEQEKNFAPTVP
jgi:hypothetical protein